MTEQTKKDNTLGKIKGINAFQNEHQAKIQAMLNSQRKYIESVQQQIASKKSAILKEEQDRLERAKERERLQQEKARLQRETEEAILKELHTPLVAEDKPAAETEAPKPQAQTETADAAPVKEAVAEKPQVAKKKKTVATETVEATKAPITEAKTEETTAQKSDTEVKTAKADDKAALQEKARQAVFAPVFEKAKKPVIEKPVIRIYVPPVEEQRPRRNNVNNMQQGQTGAPGRRPQQGGVSQGGYQPRTGSNPNYNNNRNNGSSSASAMVAAQNMLLKSMPQIPGASKDWGNKKKQDKSQYQANNNNVLENKKLPKKSKMAMDKKDLIYYEDGEENTRIRTRKVNKKQQQEFTQQQAIVITHAVLNSDHITIKALSEKIGRTGTEIIKKLFLLNIIKTINETIDFDTAELVASEFDVTLELQHTETSEEKMFALHDEEQEEDTSKLVTRPPIVTIMGHVDHGKTSILDYIRKANVASGEAGGITQHIGAYSVSLNGSPITFLDTPGHAAFTAMRARGADVTDIVVIVVAADDGIMPQTIEAINHSKAANVSIIIAVNKIDKVGADPDRVLTQLTEYGLVPEEWGGNVPVVRVSAKTGQGINDLLDTILITAELLELKANPQRQARGTIIEARLDKGKGPVATVLVQNGTLKISNLIVAGSVVGKVRAMQDDKGRNVVKAGPSMAVSILGLQEVPSAGDQLMVVTDEKLMKQVADERQDKLKANMTSAAKVSLEDVFKSISEGNLKTVSLIIKADVQGSVEALRDSLIKLSNEEVKVSVVHAVVGAINESDVMLADTTGSIIIGFNVRPDANAKALADKQNIDIKLYRVIYDAIDDVNKAIKGLLAPKFREQYLGKAEIRQVYKIGKLGNIAGCMVKDGKIVRNAKVRVIRDNIVIKETSISSLKRMKDDAKEVLAGFECGIGLDAFNDIAEGDVIESFNLVQDEQ